MRMGKRAAEYRMESKNVILRRAFDVKDRQFTLRVDYWK